VLKINLEVNQEYHIINIITHQTLIHAASAINSNKVAHVTWELKSEAEGRWNRVSLNLKNNFRLFRYFNRKNIF